MIHKESLILFRDFDTPVPVSKYTDVYEVLLFNLNVFEYV